MPVNAIVGRVLQEDGLVLSIQGCKVDGTAWVIQGGAADLQDEHEVTETSNYKITKMVNKFFLRLELNILKIINRYLGQFIDSDWSKRDHIGVY